MQDALFGQVENTHFPCNFECASDASDRSPFQQPNILKLWAFNGNLFASGKPIKICLPLYDSSKLEEVRGNNCTFAMICALVIVLGSTILK